MFHPALDFFKYFKVFYFAQNFVSVAQNTTSLVDFGMIIISGQFLKLTILDHFDNKVEDQKSQITTQLQFHSFCHG